MKKRNVVLGLILFALLAFVTPQMEASAAKDVKEVDIMFLHDTHSHLNQFQTVEDGKTVTIGGFSRIKTLVNQQKALNPNTLLVDAGDFSMGTLAQVVFEEEAAELRMLGALGMDATTLGNHEFDYKASGLANMMNTAVASGDVLPPILLCNVDWEAMEKAGFTDEQQMLWDAFEIYGVKDYIVVDKGGVKIAIIGVFGENAKACVPNCPLIFEDPIDAVRKTVAEIKNKETVDMIVCISHSGTWEDEEKSEDENLAKAVPDIDVIVSGHTHTKTDEPIIHGNTYIVSSAEYGKYLGSISLKQNENGRWDLKKFSLIPVSPAIIEDSNVQNKANAFMAQVDEKYLAQFGYTLDQVLCTNEVEFCEQGDVEDLHVELNLGSIMADAYTYAVEHASDFDGHPVDVAVVPSGTIRDTYPLGNITTEKVFNSFSLGIGEDGIPGYPLISVYLTGEELKLVAEIDASLSDLMKTARLYTDGLYWTFNPNRMILNKVTDVYICDANGDRVELEDDKLYRVVTDFYSSQMLGGVTDMSFGLLSIIPKHADGTRIERYEDAVIYVEGKELKAWEAIAQYMKSFEDTNGDGVGNVPAIYNTTQYRKVVDNSKDFGDLIKNPNKFFYMIVAIGVVLIGLLIALFLGWRKLSRKYGITTKLRNAGTLYNKVTKLTSKLKKLKK